MNIRDLIKYLRRVLSTLAIVNFSIFIIPILESTKIIGLSSRGREGRLVLKLFSVQNIKVIIAAEVIIVISAFLLFVLEKSIRNRKIGTK